jgi:GDPmannose 4,6-dehydratase
MSKYLIFGATGQDGSYLSEQLISHGHDVFCVKRRSSSINTMRLDKILDHPKVNILHGDVTDTASVMQLINQIKPEFVLNLAAQSHVGVSFNEPEYTAQVDAIGTLRILEAIRLFNKNIVFYQASTSELFGGLDDKALDETSSFNPRSPYAAAKLYAYQLTKMYREAYGLKTYNGILFNHESPRRGENFVTKKITMGLANILKGEMQSIQLGNLDALRDWGHAKDYCEAMYQMVNLNKPGDYVVATGECYSVRDFINTAFQEIGIELKFIGKGVKEKAVVVAKLNSNYKLDNIHINQTVIEINPIFFRPLDVPRLQGNSQKFRKLSGWSPKTTFRELVADMVKHDVNQ